MIKARNDSVMSDVTDLSLKKSVRVKRRVNWKAGHIVALLLPAMALFSVMDLCSQRPTMLQLHVM